MQKQDPEIEKAKQSLIPFFKDRYGRPLRKAYHVTQIQTLLENLKISISHGWFIKLRTDLLKKTSLQELKLQRGITREVFFFNKKLDTPDYRPKMERHIRSICRLIDRYSAPNVKALGKQLEGLVKAELRVQGFNIVGTHTASYENRKMDKNEQ